MNDYRRLGIPDSGNARLGEMTNPDVAPRLHRIGTLRETCQLVSTSGVEMDFKLELDQQIQRNDTDHTELCLWRSTA